MTSSGNHTHVKQIPLHDKLINFGKNKNSEINEEHASG